MADDEHGADFPDAGGRPGSPQLSGEGVPIAGAAGDFAAQAFVWSGQAFAPDVRAMEPALEIMVADSWRSHLGAAARFDLHMARFEASAARWAHDGDLTIPDAREWAAIRRGIIAAVLAAHRTTQADLFPRIGWERIGGHPEPVFVLRIRPCPPMRDDTTLLWSGLADPRLHPTIKGPDIERLGKLRGIAASRSCDDAILADPNGTVLEATTGSLVWWHQGNLVLPAAPDRVLPGVTETMVTRRATSLGITVMRANGRVDEWSERGVWFLSSVQGISPVTRVVIGSRVMHLAPPARSDDWREWWHAQFRPYSPSL